MFFFITFGVLRYTYTLLVFWIWIAEVARVPEDETPLPASDIIAKYELSSCANPTACPHQSTRINTPLTSVTQRPASFTNLPPEIHLLILEFLLDQKRPHVLTCLLRASPRHYHLLRRYPKLLSNRTPQSSLIMGLKIIEAFHILARQNSRTARERFMRCYGQWNEQRWVEWMAAWENNKGWKWAARPLNLRRGELLRWLKENTRSGWRYVDIIGRMFELVSTVSGTEEMGAQGIKVSGGPNDRDGNMSRYLWFD